MELSKEGNDLTKAYVNLPDQETEERNSIQKEYESSLIDFKKEMKIKVEGLVQKNHETAEEYSTWINSVKEEMLSSLQKGTPYFLIKPFHLKYEMKPFNSEMEMDEDEKEIKHPKEKRVFIENKMRNFNKRKEEHSKISQQIIKESQKELKPIFSAKKEFHPIISDEKEVLRHQLKENEDKNQIKKESKEEDLKEPQSISPKSIEASAKTKEIKDKTNPSGRRMTLSMNLSKEGSNQNERSRGAIERKRKQFNFKDKFQKETKNLSQNVNHDFPLRNEVNSHNKTTDETKSKEKVFGKEIKERAPFKTMIPNVSE